MAVPGPDIPDLGQAVPLGAGDQVRVRRIERRRINRRPVLECPYCLELRERGPQRLLRLARVIQVQRLQGQQDAQFRIASQRSSPRPPPTDAILRPASECSGCV